MARGQHSVRVQPCDRTTSVLALLAHSEHQSSNRQEHELQRASLRVRTAICSTTPARVSRSVRRHRRARHLASDDGLPARLLTEPPRGGTKGAVNTREQAASHAEAGVRLFGRMPALDVTRSRRRTHPLRDRWKDEPADVTRSPRADVPVLAAQRQCSPRQTRAPRGR